MDRLSELPQPILHHILCLLSQKEAIQTCVLSKSWRYIGSTRPKLEFTEGCRPWKGQLTYVVDKLLKSYHDQNLSIQEFLLDVPQLQSGMNSYLQKWISMLISSPPYVMFKTLHTLRLRNVSIQEETFEKIISSCPLIESLIIHQCKGLRTIMVSNSHNLKIFDCDNNYAVDRKFPDIPKRACPSIEIDTPTTLQSIRIGDCHNQFAHFWYWHDDNKFFPNLKSVHMYNVRLPKESFDVFSSHNSPCLEDLQLSDCHGFKEIELSSRSIKRLIINMCPIKSAVIDAPNILYFKLSFKDDVPSPFSFTKTSSCEWKSDISMSCYYGVLSQLLKLNVLLKALRQSQISLEIGFFHYSYNQRFGHTCYEGFKEPVVVEHLTLSGSFSSSFFLGFLNCLFSNFCRPRYIHDSQNKWEGHGIGRELLCKVLVREIEKMDCFWKKDLEDISTEELKDADDDDGEEFSWLHFLDSCFRLRLKWKEFSWLE